MHRAPASNKKLNLANTTRNVINVFGIEWREEEKRNTAERKQYPYRMAGILTWYSVNKFIP
mgnify:CR=1 FL=1